jgi:hypothetical protein
MTAEDLLDLESALRTAAVKYSAADHSSTFVPHVDRNKARKELRIAAVAYANAAYCLDGMSAKPK